MDKTGQFFCYVNPTSGCADKKPSQHNIGAFYSYSGCDIMSQTDNFLPRPNPKPRPPRLCSIVVPVPVLEPCQIDADCPPFRICKGYGEGTYCGNPCDSLLNTSPSPRD